MFVNARAPVRIDLAGGTIDLYPLYLMENGGITVNCAIDLYAEACLQTREDRKIHIVSLDLGVEQSAPDIESLELGTELDLVARIIKFYAPDTGLDVQVSNAAPKGSGLGASSALVIALSTALNTVVNKGLSRQEVIDCGANLEAQNIRIIAGKQDYYAATYGGLNAIWFDVDGDRIEPLFSDKADFHRLEERIILSYTGMSHVSARTNWEMIKNYLDGRPSTVKGIGLIKQTSMAMRRCLLDGDWSQLPRLIDTEWSNRKNLAEGVTTEAIDAIMANAKASGALASKLCGAGGGGCMITYVEPDLRHTVIDALERSGAHVLDFETCREGVKLQGDDRI